MTQPTNDPFTELPGNRDDEKLVTVAEEASEMGATMLVTVLKDAGIQAVAVGGFTSQFKAESPGFVEVKTFECDAEAARQVLAEVKRVDD